MIKILFPFFILPLFCSCNGPMSKKITDMTGKMIILSYDHPNMRLSTFYELDTLDVLKKKIGDNLYIQKSKGIHDSQWYNSLQIDLSDEKTIYISDKDTFHTKLVDKKVIRYYTPETMDYFVYRIIIYSGAADSQGLVYWSPDFGIVMEKSLTWHNFVRFEFLNDDEKNKKLRDLCFFIISDKEFFNLNNWEEVIKE